MKYKNVFFDLDGTLTDSGEGIMNSAIFAFERLGIAVPSEEELRKFVGPPLRLSFSRNGVPEDKVEEAVALYREKYNNQGGKFQNRVYDGIEEMLEKLRGEGYRLFIATSKPEALAREIAGYFHLDSYFDYIAGATLDKARDTKAEVIRYLIETTENTGGILMIGDTASDVVGARENNIPCVGVSWGYGDCDEMVSAGAVSIADTPRDICRMLANKAEPFGNA